MSCMFLGCDTLLSIRDISNINNFNNNDDTLIFNEINEESDLSNEDAQNEENLLFKSLKDIQIPSLITTITNKYTSYNCLTNNINKEDNLLISLEYYNFNNILDMHKMFYECKSLISLPDLSIWNASNVTNMYSMFDGCVSLASIFDIAKWNTSSVTDMNCMFFD